MAKVTGAGYFSSANPTDKSEVVTKWKYARVDLSNDITTVFPSPCRIGKVWVDTVLSAHACPIKDGSTTLWTLAASTAALTVISALENTVCETSLVVDPNDAATGVIFVQYSPL